jgi:predicted metal-dependent hydrolase
MRSFCAQEGQHYRQHARFNEALQLTKSAALVALEDEVAGDYLRFTNTRSLRFNLAYAEGFEAFTAAFALYCFEVEFGQRLQADVRELFEWHLMEELEHRTVTFDAYQQVSGGYLYRVFVGLFAQLHLLRFTFRASQALLAMWASEAARSAPAASVAGMIGETSRGGGTARLDTPRRASRARSVGRELARHLLPKVLATYLPWYTPHAIEVPAEVRARGPFYAARAASLPATPRP